ncbi:hypothetical protein ACFXHA_10280 [Nocardia sp. NPDC059240]|uniref:hypothetical protein n=1 Tax=Nocardia sp. NPDC059240 TaxID=3346786 RepID=UPI0036970777
MNTRAIRLGAATLCAAPMFAVVLTAEAGLAAAGTGSGSGSSGSSSGSAGSSSGSAGSGSSSGSASCGHQVVGPLSTKGWTPIETAGPQFVSGPQSTGATGSGALRFAITDTPGKVTYFQPTRTTLGQAANLGYTMYVDHGLEPSFQLRINGADRTDGAASGFTTLVWQPHRNGLDAGTNRWTPATNLEHGMWWSTKSIAGAPGGQGQPVPLAAIVAANPRATITAYGVNLGTATTSELSYVDAVTFGCDSWSFRPGPSSGSASGSSSGSSR